MENKIKAGDAVKMSRFCINDKGNTFIPWKEYYIGYIDEVGELWRIKKNRFNFEYAIVRFGINHIIVPLKNLTKVLDIK